MQTRSIAFVVTPLALFALTVAAPARAGDPAAAQALFNDARQLMTTGRYADACPKLEESQRLDPGVGTLFHLADCDEHIGKTASAWAAFLEVAADAKSSGQSARERVARDRAAALEPSLARLTILTGASATIPGLDVRRDGAPVGKGQWGASLPVDPGDHEIRATAPGKRPFVKSIHVDPKGRQTVEVPALADAPVAVAVVPVAPAPALASPPPPLPTTTDTAPAEHGGLGAQRGFAIGLGVAGLVGIGLGSYFGLTSKSNRDDSASHCAGNTCDASGVSLRDDAMRNGNISTVAFAAGGAALLGSIVLFASAPSHASSTTGQGSTTPKIGISPGGMTFQGAF
jgi:hypothetical protein